MLGEVFRELTSSHFFTITTLLNNFYSVFLLFI